MSKPINLLEFEDAARERLPAAVYDYYRGGAMDEVTLRENRAAYSRRPLHYRILAGVDRVDTRSSVLGIPISMPVLVAPTAFHKLAHPDGEIASLRAAARAGTVFTLSSLSNTSLEEAGRVAAEIGARFWFQLYIYKDRGVTEALIRRAEAAGAAAIVLTVDAVVWGTREADTRNNFRLPEGLYVENLTVAGKQAFPPGSGSGLKAYVTEHFDPAIGWRDLDWLCSVTKLPVIVKGVCRPEDAKRCTEHGARAVVVSNHGGRQLDTSPATLDVLASVAEVLDSETELYVDGGIRRGTDVVKAIALGARAVQIGRPVLWGLAAGGEGGVTEVLELLRRELVDVLALCGCRTLDDLDLSVLGS